MADPAFRALTALRRLRRVETDAARRGLAEALARDQALAEQQAEIEREMAEAMRIGDDFDRASFVAWIERQRIRREALAEAIRAAAMAVDAARGALASHRLAETAAEDALARRVAEHDAATARRDQAALEEAARATAGGRTALSTAARVTGEA